MSIEILYNNDILKALYELLSIHEFNNIYTKLDKRKLLNMHRTNCECGGKYQLKYKRIHEGSQKHIEYIKNK